jgi:ACS family D-galactonate transporter-like MFS transporter
VLENPSLRELPSVNRNQAHRSAILALLCAAFVIAYIDRQNLSFALSDPAFKSYFGLSDGSRGLLNSAFFWTYAALQLPAGWVADRYGVKKPFAIGFAIWSVLAGATAWAGSATQLFALRIGLGAGESINTPAGMRWIRLHIEPHRHGFAMGLYQASAKIGPAIGAPLTAWLITAYGWRVMFFVLGFGALVWLIPWLLLVEGDERTPQGRVEQQRVGSVVTLPQLFSSRVMWGIIIGSFCYNYFNYFCLTWLPAYLAESRHLSLTSTGWFTGGSFWGFALVAMASGHWADRLIARGRDPILTRKVFIIAGFVLASSEIIGAASHSNALALFFAIFSLSSLGLATGNYWALSPAILPDAPIARLAAIQNLAANIPGIVAPILTGWLKARTGGYQAPMLANLAFLLLGIASYVFLVRPKYAPPTAS